MDSLLTSRPTRILVWILCHEILGWVVLDVEEEEEEEEEGENENKRWRRRE